MLGVIVAICVVAALWALRKAGRMSPREARTFARQLAGYALFVAAGLMALRGNLLLAVPAFTFGAGLLGINSLTRQFSNHSAPPESITMDRAQAYKVLGLEPGATADDIRAAHKRLQRATHPDAGGSTFLAAQINAARDKLLKS